VDSEMVRQAFEDEARISLDGLWEAFVRNTALPSMRVESSGSGQEIVVDGYPGPLPVEVQVGEKRLSLIVTGRLRIPGGTTGVKVELDPDDIGMVSIAR